MKKCVAILILLASCGLSQAQTIPISKDNRTIAITASADVTAVADIGVVSIGFETYGTDQQPTSADGSRISNAIVKALTDAGITPDEIQSISQGLTPVSKYDSLKISKGYKYEFSQSWTVTVPSKEAASTLQAAINAGADDSGNIEWQLTNEDDLDALAAAKALAHAHEIADEMAKAINTQLGPLLYASNQVPDVTVTSNTLGAIMPEAAAADTGAEPTPAPPISLSPEKITKSATIYAVFAIE